MHVDRSTNFSSSLQACQAQLYSWGVSCSTSLTSPPLSMTLDSLLSLLTGGLTNHKPLGLKAAHV